MLTRPSQNLVSDAAIEILGTAGSRGLSHRAVDNRAGLPPGTAANYFSTRDGLLAAAAGRVAALQFEEMADATAPVTVPAEDRTEAPPGPGQLAELLGDALYDAATTHRVRAQPTVTAAFHGPCVQTLCPVAVSYLL